MTTMSFTTMDFIKTSCLDYIDNKLFDFIAGLIDPENSQAYSNIFCVIKLCKPMILQRKKFYVNYFTAHLIHNYIDFLFYVNKIAY